MDRSSYSRVSLKALIAPHFYPLWSDMRNFRHRHYWLPGGRGSTKSSLASIRMARGIMEDPMANGCVFMQGKVDIRESVLEQMMWAVGEMGVTDWWDVCTGPIQMTYRPTGQKILFRGMDDPRKTKSVKLRRGYIKYTWFEEADRLDGVKAMTTAMLSTMRGGPVFQNIVTYNPPESSANWINSEVTRYKANRLVFPSDYRGVPREWLGEAFFEEAEEMQRTNPTMYEHVYLGKVTGTGSEVFTNLNLRDISDDEIDGFRTRRHGLDLGHTNDLSALETTHYCEKTKTLYVFGEWAKHCAFPDVIFEEGIRARGLEDEPICGDAGGLGVAIIGDLNRYGANVHKAQKPKNSVEMGMLWLRRLNCIVIDPRRCPVAAREFSTYEFAKLRDGTVLADYPNRDNHSIDAVRYGNEEYIFAGRGSRLL